MMDLVFGNALASLPLHRSTSKGRRRARVGSGARSGGGRPVRAGSAGALGSVLTVRSLAPRMARSEGEQGG